MARIPRWRWTPWDDASDHASVRSDHPSRSIVRRVALAAAFLVAAPLGVLIASSATAGASTGWQVVSLATNAVSAEVAGTTCQSATFCVAVGDEGFNGLVSVSHNGGQTWTATQITPPGTANFEILGGVSCSSALDCVAVGGNFSFGVSGSVTVTPAEVTTTNGGASWSQISAPTVGGADLVVGVDCVAGTSTCYAWGASGSDAEFSALNTPEVAVSSNGGAMWSSNQLQSTPEESEPAPPSSIACWDANDCLMSFSSDNGLTAAKPTTALYTTSDGGGVWSSLSVPSNMSTLDGITCTATSVCQTVGTVGTPGAAPTAGTFATTTSGGTTWSTSSLPGVPFPVSLSCVNSTDCISVGFGARGNAGAAENLGAGWQTLGAPPGSALFGTACASATACFVGGTNSTTTQAFVAIPSGTSGVPGAGAAGDLQQVVADGLFGRTWNAYDDSAQSVGPPIVGAPSAIFDPADGHDHVYVRSNANHLVEYVNSGPPTQPWKHFDLTDAAGAGPLGGAPDAIYDQSDHLIHVYVESSFGHLTEYVDNDAHGRAWNDFDLTLASGGGNPIASTPSALVDVTGLIHVYVRSTAGVLDEYVDNSRNGHPWNAYDLTSAALGGTTLGSSPAAVLDALDGHIHIYVRSAGGRLYEFVNSDTGGVDWHAFDLSAAALGGNAVSNAPSPVIDPADAHIHVYVVSSTGALYEYVNSGAGGLPWHAYDLSSAALGGGATTGVPSALFDTADGHIHIYVRSSSGALQEYVNSDTSGIDWHSFNLSAASLGSNLASDPSALAGPPIEVFAATA